MALPVAALPLAALRQRTSEKWREYPEDVLPLFVAETDFPLAPAITEALERAVRDGDTGYVASRTPLADAYAAFAERRYGWAPDPVGMRSTADVSMGIVEILRRAIRPGERVIVNPPVYPASSTWSKRPGESSSGSRCDRPGTAGSWTSMASRHPSPRALAPCCSATRTTPPARCIPRSRCRISQRWP